jgi:PWWP domain
VNGKAEEEKSTETPAENGTSTPKPSSAKRKSLSGAAAASSAKKLNKKKSQQRITHLDAAPGEYYLARLKSFPPWPSIICDEEMLPLSLLNTRPVTTKQSDGTYKEAYADGGKRVHDRTFPIMFLETNELYVFVSTFISTFY